MADGRAGFELERLAKRCFVARCDQLFGLARFRKQPRDELFDRRLAEGTDEPVDDLAVPYGEHGRDRLHLEALRDNRVLVDVDLDELDRARGRLHDALDDRA